MTNEQAITIIRKEYLCVDRDCDIERSCGRCDLNMPSKEPILQAYKMAIQALEQEPCESCCNGEQTEKAKLCQKSYIAGMEHARQDAIPKSVIEDIRSEIAEYRDNFILAGRGNIASAVDNCIRIIDKHIKEVEE